MAGRADGQLSRPAGRSPAARAAGLVSALIALGLAGCASAASGPGPAPSAAPGTVALRFTRTLLAGHFTAASRYVAPASRNAFLVLTDGLRPSSVSGRNLAVGSTTINGPAAVVVLTGTICTGGGTAPPSASPGRPAPGACISNTDPHGGNPAFRVDLAKGPDGQWLVVYRVPTATPSTGGTGITGSSSAPAS